MDENAEDLWLFRRAEFARRKDVLRFIIKLVIATDDDDGGDGGIDDSIADDDSTEELFMQQVKDSQKLVVEEMVGCGLWIVGMSERQR